MMNTLKPAVCNTPTATNAHPEPATDDRDLVHRRVDLLTIAQAADFLHMSPSSVRLYIREGQLKAFRVAGLRKVLIPRGELLELLKPA